MNKSSRVKSFERGLNKKAEAMAEVYFQKNPQTGLYRGIVRHVDDMMAISWMPEKPLVSKNLDALKAKLQTLTELPLADKGIGEPWLPESNMPFDVQGKRVASARTNNLMRKHAAGAKALKMKYQELQSQLNKIEEELHGMGEKTPDEEFTESWRREQATEEGMLHGVDAYNDAMGQGVMSREEHENSLDPNDPYWDAPDDDDDE